MFIETKVQAQPDLEQLNRHQDGLEKEKWLVEAPGKQAFTALVLLAPRAEIPSNLPASVHPLAWEDVHDMLVAPKVDASLSPGAAEFAQVLEMRGLVDFPGFEVEAWRKYLQMRNEHQRVIAQAEAQAGSFITSLRNAVNTAAVKGRAPFNKFARVVATRGSPTELTVYPGSVLKSQSHWGHVKVLLDDGWIEVGCGTWTTRNCSPFLRAVGARLRELSRPGWQLWYVVSGIADYADLASWEFLVQQKVTEVSLLRNRDLAVERDLFSSSKIVNEIIDDLVIACRFLIDLIDKS